MWIQNMEGPNTRYIIPIQSRKETMISSFIDDVVARIASTSSAVPSNFEHKRWHRLIDRCRSQETHEKALAEEAQSATATARLRKYMAVGFCFLSPK